jgi:hypothetical protein
MGVAPGRTFPCSGHSAFCVFTVKTRMDEVPSSAALRVVAAVSLSARDARVGFPTLAFPRDRRLLDLATPGTIAGAR